MNNNNQVITIHSGGIKCDKPGCDYRDMTAKASPEWIGAPCPKCGSSLLTQEDWDTMQRIRGVVDFINWILKPFYWILSRGKQVKVSVIMDGTGKATLGDPHE